MDIVKIKFWGVGGEYVVGDITDKFSPEQITTNPNCLGYVTDWGNILHCNTIDVDQIQYEVFLNNEEVDVSFEIDFDASIYPKRDRLYLVGITHENGYFGSVDIEIKEKSEIDKIQFFCVDLCEYGYEATPLKYLSIGDKKFFLESGDFETTINEKNVFLCKVDQNDFSNIVKIVPENIDW